MGDRIRQLQLDFDEEQRNQFRPVVFLLKTAGGYIHIRLPSLRQVCRFIGFCKRQGIENVHLVTDGSPERIFTDADFGIWRDLFSRPAIRSQLFDVPPPPPLPSCLPSEAPPTLTTLPIWSWDLSKIAGFLQTLVAIPEFGKASAVTFSIATIPELLRVYLESNPKSWLLKDEDLLLGIQGFFEVFESHLLQLGAQHANGIILSKVSSIIFSKITAASNTRRKIAPVTDADPKEESASTPKDDTKADSQTEHRTFADYDLPPVTLPLWRGHGTLPHVDPIPAPIQTKDTKPKSTAWYNPATWVAEFQRKRDEAKSKHHEPCRRQRKQEADAAAAARLQFQAYQDEVRKMLQDSVIEQDRKRTEAIALLDGKHQKEMASLSTKVERVEQGIGEKHRKLIETHDAWSLTRISDLVNGDLVNQFQEQREAAALWREREIEGYEQELTNLESRLEFEQAVSDATIVAMRARTEWLETEKADLQSSLDVANDEFFDLSLEKGIADEENKDLKAALQETRLKVQATNGQLQTTHRALRSEKESRAEVEAELASTKEEKDSLKANLRDTQDKAQAIASELEAAKSALRSEQEARSTVEEKLVSTTAEKEHLESTLRDSQSKAQTSKDELERAQRELSSQKAESTALESQLSVEMEARSFAESEVDALSLDVENLQLELDARTEELIAAQAALCTIEDQSNRSQSQAQDMMRPGSDLEQHQAAISGSMGTVQEAKKEILSGIVSMEEFEKNFVHLQESCTALEKTKDDLQTQLDEKEKQLESTQKQLDEARHILSQDPLLLFGPYTEDDLFVSSPPAAPQNSAPTQPSPSSEVTPALNATAPGFTPGGYSFPHIDWSKIPLEPYPGFEPQEPDTPDADLPDLPDLDD